MSRGFDTVENVEIIGISCCVPEEVYCIENYPYFDSIKSSKKFTKLTGVVEKRHAAQNQTTLDLCLKASENLFQNISIGKDEIDIVVFVTQTPDYFIPNNAIIFQDRFGLRKETMCFDLTLGCSGYVYGLNIISKLLSSKGFKNALLLVGDTLTKQANIEDRVTYPLFGDAGSATLLSYSSKANSAAYSFWGDGSGYSSIIIPDGGYRNRVSASSLDLLEDDNGNKRRAVDTYMNGSEVLNFTLTEVPDIIRNHMKKVNLFQSDYDYFVMHQANKFINIQVQKKLSFSDEQVPFSIEKYGNTSSATIPLTICAQRITGENRLLLAGFGVGLSVGISTIHLSENFQTFLIND